MLILKFWMWSLHQLDGDISLKLIKFKLILVKIKSSLKQLSQFDFIIFSFIHWCKQGRWVSWRERGNNMGHLIKLKKIIFQNAIIYRTHSQFLQKALTPLGGSRPSPANKNLSYPLPPPPCIFNTGLTTFTKKYE